MIFLSYAKEDASAVQSLYRERRRAGVKSLGDGAESSDCSFLNFSFGTTSEKNCPQSGNLGFESFAFLGLRDLVQEFVLKRLQRL